MVTRYTLGGSGSTPTDNIQTSSGSTSGSGTQTSSGTQTTSGTQTSNQTQTTNSTTNNMDSKSRAALDKLITQLLNGGTPEMQEQEAERDAVRQQTQASQAGYSKEAAFADSQGLISQQMRRALESMLPSINRAAEDAGSSGGALRALLLQDAANKAAESSSALGVQTATQYGNINANFAQVLEALTRSDPAATQMLINALNTAKGASSTTTGTVNTVGTQTSNQTQNTSSTQNTSQQATENKNVLTDYKPFEVASTTPQFFGVVESPNVSYAGSSRANMEALRGIVNDSGWDSYKF